MKLVFEKSVKGRRGLRIAKSDVPTSINLNKLLLRETDATLPELSELDVVRHPLVQEIIRAYEQGES